MKQKNLRNLLSSLVAMSALVINLVVTSVAAAPTITVKVTKNGTTTDYVAGTTATGVVTLQSDTACMWYSGGQTASSDYVTSISLSKGYGTFSYYCVDASGATSNTVSVTVDVNQPTVLTVANTVAEGDNEVKLFSMKEAVTWYVDGKVAATSGKSYTVTGKGNHSVYAVTVDGLKSNTLTFSIPYVAASDSSTTTTKSNTNTTRGNNNNNGGSKTTTTTSYKTATEIGLELIGVSDGGSTNGEVVVEANMNAYFVINGKKMEKAAKDYTITDEGSYTVYATNAYNTVNSLSFTFTIDKSIEDLKLMVNGSETTDTVLTAPVTIKASELGYFSVNGEQANLRSQSDLVLSESGTYVVKFADEAGNETETSFILQIEDSKPATSNDTDTDGNPTNGLLYLLGGAVLGGAVVGIIMVIINRIKNKEDDED